MQSVVVVFVAVPLLAGLVAVPLSVDNSNNNNLKGQVQEQFLLLLLLLLLPLGRRLVSVPGQLQQEPLVRVGRQP